MNLGIVGCGYTGLEVARQWKAQHPGAILRGTTRSHERAAKLRVAGVEPWVVDLDGPIPKQLFHGLDHVLHLAPPPPDDGQLDAQVARLVQALRDGAPEGVRVVYGSTTGAFGQHPDQIWVDEDTLSGPLMPRGARRLRYERRLQASGLPVRVVRIAAIYGPGRGMRAALDRGMLLFEDGPLTSRIHVEDLARLLISMTGPEAPELVVACDEKPAPTLEVARYLCGLLGRPMPEVLTQEEALAQMSPQARELRTQGRRCRSKWRHVLVGPLRYPTYREGLAADLKLDAP